MRRFNMDFSDKEWTHLEDYQAQQGFVSTSDVIRRAVRLQAKLRDLASEGYTDLIVRNPSTDKEINLLIL